MNKCNEYENRVCFFIDILAFKDLVSGKGKKSVKMIKEIIDYFEKYLDESKGEIKIDDSCRTITQFSDSIFISFCVKSPSELFSILSNILYLQMNLIATKNILIRGGCAYGKTFHDEKYLFGNAVNKAYEIECKKAKYPRIIIPEDVIEECAKFSSNDYYDENDEKKDIMSFLKRDDDNFYYIDYFSRSVIESELDPYETWEAYMERIKSICQTNTHGFDEKVKEKYDWLKNKYDEAINCN